MSGKSRCKMLKEIRKRIADENDIPYATHECRYQGDCSGTCPRCESELRYLEKQLALRESLGKRVAVAALCAGMTFTAAGCTPLGLGGNRRAGNEIEGLVPYVENEPAPEPDLAGEVVPPEEMEFELLGDVDIAFCP